MLKRAGLAGVKSDRLLDEPERVTMKNALTISSDNHPRASPGRLTEHAAHPPRSRRAGERPYAKRELPKLLAVLAVSLTIGWALALAPEHADEPYGYLSTVRLSARHAPTTTTNNSAGAEKAR